MRRKHEPMPFLTKIPQNTFYVWGTNKDNPDTDDYELVHQESYKESYERTAAFQQAIDFAKKYKHAYIKEGYDTDDFAEKDGRNNDTSAYHLSGKNYGDYWDENSKGKYIDMYNNSAWYYYDPKDIRNAEEFKKVWTTEKGKLQDSRKRDTRILDKHSLNKRTFNRTSDILDAIDNNNIKRGNYGEWQVNAKFNEGITDNHRFINLWLNRDGTLNLSWEPSNDYVSEEALDDAIKQLIEAGEIKVLDNGKFICLIDKEDW